MILAEAKRRAAARRTGEEQEHAAAQDIRGTHA